MKLIGKLFLLSLCFAHSCPGPPDGFDTGGPITRYLMGRWQLVKVVAPSGTKTGAQIGYSEVLQIGNDNTNDYERIYRNDSLVATYNRVNSTPTIANAKDMTMTIPYWGNLKRYYKISDRQDGPYTKLEASAYLPEIGGVQDSVRYYYTRIR